MWKKKKKREGRTLAMVEFFRTISNMTWGVQNLQFGPMKKKGKTWESKGEKDYMK